MGETERKKKKKTNKPAARAAVRTLHEATHWTSVPLEPEALVKGSLKLFLPISNLCLCLSKMFGNKSTYSESLTQKAPRESHLQVTSSSVSSKEHLELKWAKERCHPSVFSILALSQQPTPTPTAGVLPEAPTDSWGDLDVSAVHSLHCRWAREEQSACSEPSPGKIAHGPMVLSREYNQEGWPAVILRADYFTSALGLL